MIVVILSIVMMLVGCSYKQYEDAVLNAPYFMTQMTNEKVFGKCFVAYQLSSYRDKQDRKVCVRLDGKFVLDEIPHSVQVFYRFSDREHFIITDFVIDGQSEPEVIFLYYMTQLYE
jgi:hypothetical protein